MGIPKAVLKQGEKSDQMLANMQAQREGKPVSEPNPAPAQSQPVQPQVPQQTEDFKHKYDVLQGKYNSEIPKLHTQLKEAETQNASMQERIKVLEASVEQAKQQENAQKRNATLEELKEDYPELADYLAGQDQIIHNLQAQVQTVEGNVTQTHEREVQERKQRYWALINEQVPDWEDINASDEWKTWLNGTDEMSGQNRGALLDHAQDQLNGEWVVKIFNTFKQVMPQLAQALPSAQLQNQVTPTPGGGSGNGVPQKRTYTRAEVHQFFQDKIRGRLKHLDPQEVAAMEQDITAADVEGRIVQ